MRYKILNDFLKLEVNSLGAEAVSLQSLPDQIEFIWQGDARYWARHSPILFPIVGALRNNKFTLNGKEYEMAQHGFARDSEFELKEAADQSLTFFLKENPQTLKQFPFPFELSTCYKLEGRAVLIRHEIVNTGREKMWFSIGEHPGFNCPLFSNETMEDYSLEFEKEERLERRFLENSLLTKSQEIFLNNEKKVKISRELFKRKAIILENFRSGSVSLISKNHQRKVTVTFDGYPYLGIWSPEAGAPFVCLEPWYGVASPEDHDGDITRKPGILSLGPANSFNCGYKIIID